MSMLTEEQKVMISAYADGESDAPEAVVELLLNNTQAQAWLQSIQQQKQQLTQLQTSIMASASLFDRVSRAIDDEETYQISPSPIAANVAQNDVAVPWYNRWLMPAGGLAVAATVAAVTVFSVQNINDSNGQVPYANAPMAALETMSSAEPSATSVPPNGFATVANQESSVNMVGIYEEAGKTYWEGSDQAVQHELNRYLVDHSEYATPGGFNSIVPYVRIAGYDDE